MLNNKEYSYLDRVIERLHLVNGVDIEFTYSEEDVLNNMKYINWCENFGLSPYKCLTFLSHYMDGDYIIDLKKDMDRLRVVKIDDGSIEFENGIMLFSEHIGDCCEHHWLSMEDLTMSDFDGLEFDLTNDNFFRRIDGYGIELVPISGYSVKIPGYGSNNGYYSSDLSLVLTDNKDFSRNYDITECQDW